LVNRRVTLAYLNQAYRFLTKEFHAMGWYDWVVEKAEAACEACGPFWDKYGDSVKKGLVRGASAAVAGAVVGAVLGGPVGAVAGATAGAAVGGRSGVA
jgi:ABC-type dipeptide/oligopeptide/nickel transport system permease subunit